MARTLDPRTAPPIRWGIIGTGGIAGVFADAVGGHTRAQVVAVGSRHRDRAERFATAHHVPTAHTSYRALVEDTHVDAVYVASPHSEHAAHARLAIAAGKHVLVEKSFTRNVTEAREVFAAADKAGVFVMEGMWTRFLPHVAAMHQSIDAGEIGEIINVRADHGQFFRYDPSHRVYAPELAGGALLDLGVYPVAWMHDLLGVPTSVHAFGQLTETGVDGQVTVVAEFGERKQANLFSTLWAKTPTTSSISGTEGHVRVAGDFYRPTSFVVTRQDGRIWTFDQPVSGGLQYEAAEASRCIAEGRTQSDRMTWQNTLDILTTMDEVRRQIGVAYPGES